MTDAVVPQAEHVHVHLDPPVVAAAYAGQRRRFAAGVAGLGAEDLARQSRCGEWTVADVLRHGCDADSWMRHIWAGEALPFTEFDPRTTPHEFVVAARAHSDLEVRDRFVASCEAMAAEVEAWPQDRYGAPSLSPLGAVPQWMSLLHVYWDSWLHERDALLPLGLAQDADPADGAPVVAYSLALAGRFVRAPIDTVVAGVRLVTGPPITVTPVSGPGATFPSVVDDLCGRDGGRALAADHPDVADELAGLARFLRSTPTSD